jgi:hypothetical protein
MKKLTILFYLLSCSAGSVAQDLWSLPGPNEKNRIASCELVDNDSDLVHSPLEVEDALVGPLRTEKVFDNDLVPLLLVPKLRNPLDRMKNGSCSILDLRTLYEKAKDESGLEEGYEGLESKEMAQVLFNYIVWSPRIWNPPRFLFDSISRTTEMGFPYWARSLQGKWIIYDEDELEEDELEENDSEFLQSGTVPYPTRARSFKEGGFFAKRRFIWDPVDPIFLLFENELPVPVFSNREFFPDEAKQLLIPQKEKETLLIPEERPLSYLYMSWFSKNKNTKERYFELLVLSQRWLRTNSSLLKSNELFRSTTLSESYYYLSNLFLSNGTLLDQMTKTLLRKGWILPDEMNENWKIKKKACLMKWLLLSAPITNHWFD